MKQNNRNSLLAALVMAGMLPSLAQAQKAGQEYSDLEAKLEAAYSRWEELAELQ